MRPPLGSTTASRRGDHSTSLPALKRLPKLSPSLRDEERAYPLFQTSMTGSGKQVTTPAPATHPACRQSHALASTFARPDQTQDRLPASCTMSATGSAATRRRL